MSQFNSHHILPTDSGDNMSNKNHNVSLLSWTLLCSVALMNSSCSNGTRVSWQPFKRDKDQQLAQSTSPQAGKRSGSLFSRDKYTPVDPFLVEQTAKAAPKSPVNTDLPADKTIVDKASSEKNNVATASLDQAFNQKPPATVVQTTAKNATTPPASTVIPWDDFSKQQASVTPPQITASSTTLAQNTPPQTEEFTIGKLGTGKYPAPKSNVSQVSSSQPFCPPDMNSPHTAECPPWTAQQPTSPMGGFENYAPLSEINPSPQNLADEYLFDGGDRKQKVYKTQEGLQGLHSEDTVAQYKDHTGQAHTKPSNRVAVYAPKFGAVSSTSDPVVQENVDKVLATHDEVRTSGYDAKAGVITRQQNDKLNANIVRSGPSGLDHLQEFGDVTKTQQTIDHTKLANPYMERNNAVANQNRLRQAPSAVNTLLAAQLWTRVLNPVVVARDQQANEIYSRFREQELVGTEERKSPGNLVITKHADKIQALQGDEISFQIEFENTGDLPLTEVRIIDNLTPRLQFVQGSATCSLEGKLDIQDNGEGSLILRWELAEPLQGHSKGVVSFKTTVH
jgi:uncharacterized repeat protein (TIGR01451 family)